MSTQTTPRPGSVTLVVVLTWLVAIITILNGVFLLVGTDAALESMGLSLTRSTYTGWLFTVVGLVIALFAMALGHGSNFARVIISLLMAFRFVMGAIAVVVLFGTAYMWSALLVTVVALLILYLLWNARASAWFSAR